VVNSQRTFKVAALAGIAAIEQLGHLIDFLFGQGGAGQKLAPHPAGCGEVPPEHIQQKIGAVTGNIMRVARHLISLTTYRAAGAFGTGVSVNFKEETVVTMTQNRRKGGEELLDAVAGRERLFNVVMV
jgi:hypothetical protein